MAGSTSAVTVSGDKKLVRAFDKLGKRAGDFDRPYERAGSDVAEAARAGAPVVSGDLRSSIESDVGRAGVVVYFGRGLPYAGPIHFGWHARNIEPNPFLTDAVEEQRDNIERAFIDHTDDIVRKFDRDAP